MIFRREVSGFCPVFPIMVGEDEGEEGWEESIYTCVQRDLLLEPTFFLPGLFEN